MYKPFSELVKDIDPAKENFISVDLSNYSVFCTILKGDNVTLGYVRNRQDSWYNTLRDMNTPEIIKETTLSFNLYNNSKCEFIRIWDEDTTEFTADCNSLKFSNIKYGIFFKIEKC